MSNVRAAHTYTHTLVGETNIYGQHNSVWNIKPFLIVLACICPGIHKNTPDTCVSFSSTPVLRSAEYSTAVLCQLIALQKCVSSLFNITLSWLLYPLRSHSALFYLCDWWSFLLFFSCGFQILCCSFCIQFFFLNFCRTSFAVHDLKSYFGNYCSENSNTHRSASLFPTTDTSPSVVVVQFFLTELDVRNDISGSFRLLD